VVPKTDDAAKVTMRRVISASSIATQDPTIDVGEVKSTRQKIP